MSNRTDFHEVATELAEMFGLSSSALERIETELHNAYVAGEEGHGCECTWCEAIRKRADSPSPALPRQEGSDR